VATNVEASNGVIHVVEAVLLPEADSEAGSDSKTVTRSPQSTAQAATGPELAQYGGGNGVANGNTNHVVPTFKVCSVERDESVTILTANFPADQTFVVNMGLVWQPQPTPYGGHHGQPPMGQHHGGPMIHHPNRPMPPRIWIPYYEAGTFESGQGGTLELTFDIPPELAGAYKISIVARTMHQNPYLAYNWFYNNTADVCNETNNS
jgi:hypothetical protein